jgi:hypothetical protein
MCVSLSFVLDLCVLMDVGRYMSTLMLSVCLSFTLYLHTTSCKTLSCLFLYTSMLSCPGRPLSYSDKQPPTVTARYVL